MKDNLAIKLNDFGMSKNEMQFIGDASLEFAWPWASPEV